MKKENIPILIAMLAAFVSMLTVTVMMLLRFFG